MVFALHRRHRFLPLIAFSCPLNAVLEEVGSELGALLLVIVRIGAELVRVALGSSLELWRGGPLLARHGRIQVSIAGLLASATSSARPRGAGGSRASGSVASGASSASEVLVRKLMCQTGVGVVAGARRVGASLVVVGALGEIGVVRLHCWRWVTGGKVLLLLGLLLLLVRRQEVVVGLRVAVLLLGLLGLLHATGARLALLGRIDRLREGGGGGRIGAVGVDTKTVGVGVIVGNIQVQTIALVVHCTSIVQYKQYGTILPCTSNVVEKLVGPAQTHTRTHTRWTEKGGSSLGAADCCAVRCGAGCG